MTCLILVKADEAVLILQCGLCETWHLIPDQWCLPPCSPPPPPPATAGLITERFSARFLSVPVFIFTYCLWENAMKLTWTSFASLLHGPSVLLPPHPLFLLAVPPRRGGGGVLTVGLPASHFWDFDCFQFSIYHLPPLFLLYW